MDEINRHILNTIESKRMLLGMSKAELARRMGIDSVTLGTMLRGQRSMYADEAMKLCAYLDIEPSKLLSPELRQAHSVFWGQSKNRPTVSSKDTCTNTCEDHRIYYSQDKKNPRRSH